MIIICEACRRERGVAVDFNYLSPYIRVAQDSLVPNGMKLRERVIFDYELVYIKSGEAMTCIDGVTYHCIPGDIIFIQPGVPHSSTVLDKPLRQPHVHFDLFYQPNSPDIKVSFKPLDKIPKKQHPLFREPVSVPNIIELLSHLRLKSPATFEKILYDLIHEYNSMLPFSDIAVKGKFIELWTYFLREVYLSQNENLHNTMILLDKIKKYLDANLDREVNLDELASYANLNKCYIAHIFKQHYGISPIKYHRIARISKARELIEFTDLPISRISEEVGYPNVYSFSRAFKAVEKVPPTFYR